MGCGGAGGLERSSCVGAKQSSGLDPKLPWWGTRVSEATHDSASADCGGHSLLLSLHPHSDLAAFSSRTLDS